MSKTRIRDKRICVHVTERERNKLKKKAKKAGLNVSRLTRESLIYSDDLKIVLIDTAPFTEVLNELRRQGVNLNQLVKNLNTYGVDAYEKDEANRICEELGDAYLNVTGALIALRKEADRHKVVIDFERYATLDDED